MVKVKDELQLANDTLNCDLIKDYEAISTGEGDMNRKSRCHGFKPQKCRSRILIVVSALFIGGVFEIHEADAGNINELQKFEGLAVSTINTVTSVPAFFIGQAMVVTPDVSVIYFSVTDPIGTDDPDLLILNLTNQTGKTINTLDIQLGQINANNEFEHFVAGGPSFLALPTIGGKLINPSHLRIEKLGWESHGNPLAVDSFLFVPTSSVFNNSELAFRFEAIVVPEVATGAAYSLLVFSFFWPLKVCRAARVELIQEKQSYR